MEVWPWMCVLDAPSLRLCPFLPCTLLAPMAHRACAHLSSSPPSLPGRPVWQEADVPLGTPCRPGVCSGPASRTRWAGWGHAGGGSPATEPWLPRRSPTRTASLASLLLALGTGCQAQASLSHLQAQHQAGSGWDGEWHSGRREGRN